MILPYVLGVFMKKLMIIVFIVFCNINCQQQATEIKQVYLDSVQSINDLSDGSYISMASTIQEYNGLLYFADMKNSRVVCLDKSLNVNQTYGSAGMGPGKFRGLYQFVIKNDKIFANNEYGQKIVMFNIDGSYVDEFKVPINYGLQYAVDNNEHVYFSAPFEDSISVFDTSGNKIKTMGKAAKNIKKYGRHLTAISIGNVEYILAVYQGLPILELYSLDGEKVVDYDLSKIEFIENRLEYVKTKKQEPNSTYILFSKICVDNNNAYLLFFDDKDVSNKVLNIEFDLGLKPRLKEIVFFSKSEETPFYTFAMGLTKTFNWVAFDAIGGDLHILKEG